MSISSIVPANQFHATPEVFKFGPYDIRIVRDENGEPIFIATDLCEALDLGNVSMAVERLDEDERGITTIDTPSIRGATPFITVTESGMYHLIFTSRKPEAVAFRRWVTEEVLPALRKTGTYVGAPLSSLDILEGMVAQFRAQDTRMKELEAKAEQADQRLIAVEARIGAAEEGSNFYRVSAYARVKGIRLRDGMITKVGRFAAKWSREHGYDIGRLPDPTWGQVNTYHKVALEYAFGKIAIQWPLPEGEEPQ